MISDDWIINDWITSEGWINSEDWIEQDASVEMLSLHSITETEEKHEHQDRRTDSRAEIWTQVVPNTNTIAAHPTL